MGAGTSGLAAARVLKGAGHQTLVFEQSSHVGGRVATRTIGPYIFDTGATSIAPRGMAIEHAMLVELDKSELIQVVKPIYTHNSLRVFPGDAARANVPRYTYISGNNELPRQLAEGLQIRFESQVDEIEKLKDHRYSICGEVFDALVLTPPIPQVSAILWSLGETRPVSNSNYRPCLSVMLGFDRALPPQHYHALLDTEQTHPLTWLSLETEKCPGRAPDGHTAMVAQLNGPYSHGHYDDSKDELVDLVLGYLERLYGPGWDAPVASDVKRWKYSQPEGIASFDSVNRPGSRLLVAGDGLMGGRTEQAFEAGVRAAKMLLSE